MHHTLRLFCQRGLPSAVLPGDIPIFRFLSLLCTHQWIFQVHCHISLVSSGRSGYRLPSSLAKLLHGLRNSPVLLLFSTSLLGLVLYLSIPQVFRSLTILWLHITRIHFQIRSFLDPSSRYRLLMQLHSLPFHMSSRLVSLVEVVVVVVVLRVDFVAITRFLGSYLLGIIYSWLLHLIDLDLGLFSTSWSWDF